MLRCMVLGMGICPVANIIGFMDMGMPGAAVAAAAGDHMLLAQSSSLV